MVRGRGLVDGKSRSRSCLRRDDQYIQWMIKERRCAVVYKYIMKKYTIYCSCILLYYVKMLGCNVMTRPFAFDHNVTS